MLKSPTLNTAQVRTHLIIK